MIDIKTIRVLIVDDSPNDAEQSLNVLRNAGYAVRPKQITDMNTLKEALDSQTWDLCLSRFAIEAMTSKEVLNTIAKQGKDVPVIVTTETHDRDSYLELLKTGARGYVLEDDDQLLLQTIKTELSNLNNRRKIKELEESLRESEKRCSLLLQSSKEAISYVHEGMHIYANPAYSSLFGYTHGDELEGIPIMDMISPKDQKSFKEYSKRYHKESKEAGVFECQCHREDGTHFNAELAMSPAMYHNEDCTQVIVRLKESHQALDEQAQKLSEQDLMTGLYNRQYLISKLDSLITQVSTHGNVAYIIYIEVADFNSIKQELGLGGSDLIISDTAECVKSVISSKEHLLARYFDDVFTILMPESDREEALKLADAIYDKVESHISDVADNSVNINCNIGICKITEIATSSQDLLSQAYNACVKARTKADRRIECFEGVTKEQAASEKAIVSQIQKALVEGKFKLLYQPIVSLHGESKQYYEVLLRMYDHNGEQVRPDQFFEAADHAGLLSKIDRWVILQATKVLSEHRLKGNNTYMFVKLSLSSLSDESLLPWISAALKSARLPADALIFEYSETDAATHLKDAKLFSQKLNEIHCQTAIYRFGSGLNSFNTLKHLNVQYVKLDGTFTKDIYDDTPDAKQNLSTMTKSLHSLGKLTIVPYVEDAHILPTLYQAGVNYIQGYYLQRPGEGLDYNFEGHEEDL